MYPVQANGHSGIKSSTTQKGLHMSDKPLDAIGFDSSAGIGKHDFIANKSPFDNPPFLERQPSGLRSSVACAMRDLVAPMAKRMAISRRRVLPRASSRFAADSGSARIPDPKTGYPGDPIK
jgi:hypothetical protein